ncbi:hypothetical protein C7B61_20855, partial [filamentous cyanobacterium CCP1]
PFLPFAGACGLGIKRSLHEAVSGFDEDFTHLEDAEYCLRVQRLGTPLFFVPDAIVHIRYSASQDHSFISSRKASFKHGYNWGNGLAKIYQRYRAEGMYLHGIIPRLAVSIFYFFRCIISGFHCDNIWKLGWHIGVLHGFIQNRIMQL